jgi:hypothetical protein
MIESWSGSEIEPPSIFFDFRSGASRLKLGIRVKSNFCTAEAGLLISLL